LGGFGAVFGEFGLGLGLVGAVPGVVPPGFVVFGFVVLGFVPFGLVLFGAVLFGLFGFGLVVFGFVLPGVCAPGVVVVPGVVGVVPGVFAPGLFGVVCPGWACGVVVPGPGAVLPVGGGGVFGDCAPGCPDCPGDPGAVEPGLEPGDDCAIIHVALENRTENNPSFLHDEIMMASKGKTKWQYNLASVSNGEKGQTIRRIQ
jgi:hypothetical protein